MQYGFVETLTTLKDFQERCYIHIMDNVIESQREEVNVHSYITRRVTEFRLELR